MSALAETGASTETVLLAPQSGKSVSQRAVNAQVLILSRYSRILMKLEEGLAGTKTCKLAYPWVS